MRRAGGWSWWSSNSPAKRAACFWWTWRGRPAWISSAGAWIRPVSPRPKGELSSWEYSYDDGGRPKVLDIIDVPLVREARENPQTENHIVAPTGRWKKAGEL